MVRKYQLTGIIGLSPVLGITSTFFVNSLHSICLSLPPSYQYSNLTYKLVPLVHVFAFEFSLFPGSPSRRCCGWVPQHQALVNFSPVGLTLLKSLSLNLPPLPQPPLNPLTSLNTT